MSSKSNKEIEYITKSCGIASSILNKCIKNIKKFKNEKQVLQFLKKETKKNKVKLAFKPVVAIANNAAVTHHKPSNRKLKQGFLILDFGVKYKSYCSDITRTIYIGKIKKKEIFFYNLVLKTQLLAIKKLKVGMKCNDLYNTAANALGNYKKYFIHRLGHGVGKRIHESPSLGSKNNRRLKDNIVLTIEPGIYLKKKFGIRIEDTILLKKNKVKILTKTPKKLIIVK